MYSLQDSLLKRTGIWGSRWILDRTSPIEISNAGRSNDTIIDSLRHAVAEIETDQKYQLLNTQARQNQLLLDHLSHVYILHPVYIRECLDDCITSLPSSLHCHLLIVMQEKEITWNQIEKTFDAYHLFYTQLLLPTFPQFDRIVLYREEMLKNFSSSQIQPGHNIQGCISALSAAIQARSHTETEQALDQLAQSLLAFSSMHHFHSIFPMYLKNEPAFHQENTEICPYTIRLHRYRACKNILRPVSGKNGGFS